MACAPMERFVTIILVVIPILSIIIIVVVIYLISMMMMMMSFVTDQDTKHTYKQVYIDRCLYRCISFLC